MKRYYVESKESVALMRLCKICKDEFFSSFYKHRRIKNFGIKCSGIINSIFSIPKYGIRKSLLKILWAIFQKMIKNYELRYDFDDETEFSSVEDIFISTPKIVVYTSVFGNYDKILEPIYKNPAIDYIAITDQALPKNSVWKKLDMSNYIEFKDLDAYHKAKFCKMFPHKLFPNYDFSIWVDGNVQIVADIFPLVLKTNENFMATYKNPLHDDIYTEGRFCVYCDAVSLSAVKKQLSAYKRDGFRRHFGMREFSIIVRAHNNEMCKKLMEQWWEQVNTYTMRDQLSFPYVLWKNHLDINTVQLLGENWRHNPRFVAKSHSRKHSIK